MKYFGFFLKQALMPLIYLFFMAVTAVGILIIKDLIWLKVILLGLNLFLYLFIVASAAYHDGQKALKVRIANDMERRQIILTGEDRPLKIREEFKVWKGFVIGGFACLPLIILLIIHTVLISAFGSVYNGAGVLAGFLCMVVFAFFRLNGTIASATFYYWSLVYIPIIVLTQGIAYYLGGKKIELQQEKIKEKHREIYGD